MLIASVIVDVSARSVDRAFDYLVSPQLGGIEIGCAVSVEFGSRPVVGYVVDLRETESEPLGANGRKMKLKPLAGVLSEPYFDKTSARLAMWLAEEYLCPLPEALKLFTPPGGAPKIKRVEGEWRLVFPGVGPVDDRWVIPTEAALSYVPASNAVKQAMVLDALSCGGMRMAELSMELGQVSQCVKALERRGIVRIERRRRLRKAMESVTVDDTLLKQLTSGQQEAFESVCMAMERAWAKKEYFQIANVAGLDDNGGSRPEVVVVDGITGSGKTEVYLRAIAKALEAGKSACVLVPEIALTPQTVGRFRARFGDNVAVLHSKLSTGERFDQWDLVRNGCAKVVVGTRSALFAPLRDLGLLIIDEEHEGSYKQDSSPRYVARDVALRMAQARGAALVLGSATPDIITLARSDGSSALWAGWHRVVLNQRPSGQPLPPVTVVDMGKEFKSGSRSMFSAQLTEALLRTYEAGEKSVLLLNKRGFASFVLCRECGFVPQCPSCSVSLTYHEVGNKLVCHHCDHSEDAPPRCPSCGSPYLRKFGAGTQRVEDELRSILPPEVPIIRMDADTTKGKGAHEALLAQFASSEGGVLLGTQMIAKGLDFPDVTLVGVINADTTLNLPDYRAPERTYQLLEQVSGRAGRAQKPGHVVVQTYCPDHPAVIAASKHERSEWLDEELLCRRELGYPPYKRLANILIWGANEEAVRQCSTELLLAIASAMISAGADWELLGPAPCILSRLKGKSRWHILVKAPAGESFSGVLAPVLAKRRSQEEVRVAVDVDPVSLL